MSKTVNLTHLSEVLKSMGFEGESAMNLVLDLGADPNRVGKPDWPGVWPETGLIFAVRFGWHAEAVIRHPKTDLNARGSMQRTALF